MKRNIVISAIIGVERHGIHWNPVTDLLRLDAVSR